MNDDRIVRGRPLELGGSGSDPRMNDGLQPLARALIAKDALTHRRAVEAPVGAQYLATELGDDLSEPRCSGLDDLSGQPVRVNNDRAVARKDSTYLRLARGNAASQPDPENHESIVSSRSTSGYATRADLLCKAPSGCTLVR